LLEQCQKTVEKLHAGMSITDFARFGPKVAARRIVSDIQRQGSFEKNE